MVTICGGGEIQTNEHMAALYDYDATPEVMRRVVTAYSSADPAYPADDAYVMRRHESATIASAPGKPSPPRASAGPVPSRRRGAERAGTTGSASPCSSRGRRGQTAAGRRAGRDRRDRSPVRDRPLSENAGTARNWNRPTSSTPLLLDFSRSAGQ